MGGTTGLQGGGPGLQTGPDTEDGVQGGPSPHGLREYM